jgi:hypothetical protein
VPPVPALAPAPPCDVLPAAGAPPLPASLPSELQPWKRPATPTNTSTVNDRTMIRSQELSAAGSDAEARKCLRQPRAVRAAGMRGEPRCQPVLKVGVGRSHRARTVQAERWRNGQELGSCVHASRWLTFSVRARRRSGFEKTAQLEPLKTDGAGSGRARAHFRSARACG